jgi:thiol-disulfide isomerase/thioredoxin
MISISLGPLALPVGPLMLLAIVWLAAWLATRVAASLQPSSVPSEPHATLTSTPTPTPPAPTAGDRHRIGNTVFHAAWIGLACARIGHVAAAADLYFAQPLSLLDLRDGGWSAPAGWAGAAAWLAWRGWRHPAGRRPWAVAGLSALLLWGAGQWWITRSLPTGLPPLTLLALEDGREVALPQIGAGQPRVVNLWASWCGPCRQEMPLLAQAQQREAQVRFLFVNQGESSSAVQAYLAHEGFALRDVWRDPTAALGPAVGSRGLPTTLFYDAQGRLVGRHFGVLNGPALETRLRELRPPAH